MNNKKFAQQEIVGFVLIVALVIVALMVFLVISLRSSSSSPESNSLEVENILTSVMRYTTSCAINFEPEYDTFKDLFKSCYRGLTCKNLVLTACDYLNQSLSGVMGNLLNTTNLDSYSLDIIEEDGSGRKGFMQLSSGSCEVNSRVSSTQKNLAQGSNKLVIRLSLCSS